MGRKKPLRNSFFNRVSDFRGTEAQPLNGNNSRVESRAELAPAALQHRLESDWGSSLRILDADEATAYAQWTPAILWELLRPTAPRFFPFNFEGVLCKRNPSTRRGALLV